MQKSQWYNEEFGNLVAQNNYENKQNGTGNIIKDLLKIGIIGYSGKKFDEIRAMEYLLQILTNLLGMNKNKTAEVVSGYTDCGVPKIAYQIAEEMRRQGKDVVTVGFSAKEALNYDVHNCDKKIIIGEKFGDESKDFVDYCDVMIRVGGGAQSMREIEMFKQTGKPVYELDLPVLTDSPTLKSY